MLGQAYMILSIRRLRFIAFLLKTSGKSNSFLSQTRHPLAIKYNGKTLHLIYCEIWLDQSVLEMHHVSATFSLLKKNEYNIFAGLIPEELKKMREWMIMRVLATDMSKHFEKVSSLKARRTASGAILIGSNSIPLDFNIQVNEKDRGAFLDLAFHAADISNPIKPFHIYKSWVSVLFTEYWAQVNYENN